MQVSTSFRPGFRVFGLGFTLRVHAGKGKNVGPKRFVLRYFKAPVDTI